MRNLSKHYKWRTFFLSNHYIEYIVVVIINHISAANHMVMCTDKISNFRLHSHQEILETNKNKLTAKYFNTL